MKVTYNWLKDFVEIQISAQKLAEKLTMAGLEVISLERKDGDFVFEFEVTSNRPDWLSVIGIAREVAAILDKKLTLPKLVHNVQQSTVHSQRENKKLYGLSTMDYKRLSINIQNKRDCPLYIGRIVMGINVRPSPGWLKKRLELVGLRSVNNIVDITNYLLLETGQPLHAFDMDRLIGNTIFIRRAKSSENIVTIDRERRNLTNQILVIADGRKPVAIAGVMGGRDSEVSNKTRNILLEAAVFNPIVTRLASRALGLSSESSYRFERGIDIENIDFVSRRAANLILGIAGGGLTLTKTTTKPKTKNNIIMLRNEEVNRVLGRDYPLRQIETVLTALSFKVKRSHEKQLKIGIPSFRIDINQPIDLIEEVARISGYDNIPSRLPKIIPQAEISPIWRERRFVKNILISAGLNEAITYSLMSKDILGQFGYPGSQLITIANPLTAQQEVLRPSLIPGLISCISYNLNQKQKNIRLFEIGNIFDRKGEEASLGLVYNGGEYNLLYIKGALEMLLKHLGIMEFEFLRGDYEQFLFRKDVFLSLFLGKRRLAHLGMVKPDILDKLDINDFIFAAELDLELLFAEFNKAKKSFTPLPLYPEVTRDISVVLKEDVAVGDIIRKIKTDKIPYLVELNLKDCYLGEQIRSGYKGLTLSCIYRASDRTLTTQEIDVIHQKISSILKTEFSAQQR